MMGRAGGPVGWRYMIAVDAGVVMVSLFTGHYVLAALFLILAAVGVWAAARDQKIAPGPPLRRGRRR